MAGNTMRAAVLDRFGGIDALDLRDIPVPEIGPNDVLVRVEWAGVGSWDATEREGHYDGAFGMPSTFPYVLGWDGAGTIAATGGSVTRFKQGDRVYAASMPLPRGGFYAEYAAVAAEHVSLIPEKLSTEQAGVMAWDALTGLSGLDVLNLKASETLMIFGASGGIGHMALQLAKLRGLRVFAVASGDDGVALAQRLGADAVVNGRKDDVMAAARAFAPDGLDAALLMVGSDAANAALRALRVGAQAATPYGVMPEPIAPSGVKLVMYNGDRGAPSIERLNKLIESGPFAPHVAQSFALDQVTAAHRALASHYVGKLALKLM